MDIWLTLGNLRGSIREWIMYRTTSLGMKFRYLVSESETASGIERLADLNPDSKSSQLAELDRMNAGSKASQRKMVFRVENATVDLISGYVFDKDLKFLADSSSWNLAHSMVRFPAPPRRSRVIDRAIDFAFLTSEAYYHWLIEDVPAYLQAKKSSPDAITIVRRNPPHRVRSLLRLLGEEFEEVSLVVKVPSLVFASKGSALSANPTDIKTLRDFRDSLELPASTIRKIYISRKVDGRVPENELDVEALMSELGFEIVSLTGIELDVQMALFANAEVVVGTHGAGLANLVWCKANQTKVVEIMRDGQPHCFEHLASAGNLDYSNVKGKAEGLWMVNLKELRRLLS
jgi:hypothetical protein